MSLAPPQDMTHDQLFALGYLVGLAARFRELSAQADYMGLSKCTEEWSTWRNKAREYGVTDKLVAEYCKNGIQS